MRDEIKVAIVDDEQCAINNLNDYFNKLSKEIEVGFFVTAFDNVTTFLSSCRNLDFDLICLDIEMPQMTGMQLAHEIRKIDSNVAIMFITNMAQYALAGYEVGAIDFIVKPVSFGDFSMKMRKAIRYLQRNADKKITLITETGIVNLSTDVIYYVEVTGHYLLYYYSDGILRVRGSMNDTEKNLPSTFVRCANSFLVNLKYVDNVATTTVKVAGTSLPITRTRKQKFVTAFTLYIGGLK